MNWLIDSIRWTWLTVSFIAFVAAECLDHPGPAATAAAQRYYDRERGSILRRYIRRTCLER